MDMDPAEARERLGIEPGASLDEIDRAFKARAIEAHPDQGGVGDDMVALSEARAVVKRTEASGQGTPTDLVAAGFRELATVQASRNQALDARARSAEAVERAARTGALRLKQRTQRTAAAAGFAAVMAAAATAVSAVGQLDTSYATVTALVAALFLVAAGILALRAWLMRSRVERLQIDIEELGARLGRRVHYAELVRRLAAAMKDQLGESNPISSGEDFTEAALQSAIEVWATFPDEGAPPLLRDIGSEPFFELVLAKGLENGLLIGEERLVRGELTSIYRFQAGPRTSLATDGASDAESPGLSTEV